jgi:hypothetical protein
MVGISLARSVCAAAAGRGLDREFVLHPDRTDGDWIRRDVADAFPLDDRSPTEISLTWISAVSLAVWSRR